MNRFSQSHIQNLQFTTVKMAYVTCLVTKNFTFELPGKCGEKDEYCMLQNTFHQTDRRKFAFLELLTEPKKH